MLVEQLERRQPGLGPVDAVRRRDANLLAAAWQARGVPDLAFVDPIRITMIFGFEAKPPTGEETSTSGDAVSPTSDGIRSRTEQDGGWRDRLVPAGVPVTWRCPTARTCLLVSIPALLVADVEYLPTVELFLHRDEALRGYARAFLRFLEERVTPHPEELTAWAQLFAWHLTSQYCRARDRGRVRSAGTEANRVLADVIGYIESDPARPMYIEDLAGMAGLRRGRFCRLFREAKGLSPHQFILAKRVELAKRLLAGTDTAIGAIALDAGFSSQSHMTHTLKRLTGLTPLQYRREQHGAPAIGTTG